MPAVINYGSINIDYVYRVPHLVQPGETLSSVSLATLLGGKGANQSVALARAGVEVAHIGRLSHSDQWAMDMLADMGVSTQHIELIDGASGHAIIQVDDNAENSIVLHGGANQSFALPTLEDILLRQRAGAEYLLMQNECNLLEEVVSIARQAELKIALNPAPMSDAVSKLPLTDIAILIVNQVEAEALAGASSEEDVIRNLSQLAPQSQIVLTLGAAGAVWIHKGECIRVSSPAVKAVDTTGAGDTFVGFFLAGVVAGMTGAYALQRACVAASIAVTREGATPSIPTAAELTAAL